MPRGKRKRAQAVQIIEEQPSLTPEQEAAMVTWPTQSTERFWCPACGQVADMERLNDAPYMLRTAEQRFGGSMPGYMQKGKVNVRRGYIQYFEHPPEDPMVAAELIPILREALEYCEALAEGVEPAYRRNAQVPKYVAPPLEPEPLLLEPERASQDEMMRELGRSLAEEAAARRGYGDDDEDEFDEPDEDLIALEAEQKALAAAANRRALTAERDAAAREREAAEAAKRARNEDMVHQAILRHMQRQQQKQLEAAKEPAQQQLPAPERRQLPAPDTKRLPPPRN